jgi:conjugal transfer pilus assembly protein TraV
MKRAILLLLPTLSACVNLAGLEGKSEFACKAPDGVVCTSVSGVYANALAGVLPAQQSQGQAKAKAKATRADAVEGEHQESGVEPRPYGATVSVTSTPTPGTPLLSPPKVLRLWLAPRVDEDGDLHDASFLYVMWHRGEWQIEHTRRQVQRQFTPVSAPIASGAADATARKDGIRQNARDTVVEAAQQGGHVGNQVSDDDR